MIPTSAAFVTDSLVQPPEVEHLPVRGGVARVCRERPDYWDGNLLALDRPPSVGDLTAALATWRDAIAPAVERITLSWETDVDAAPAPALVARATEIGLALSCNVVLALRASQASPPAAAALRRIAPGEWGAVEALALEEVDDDAARAFLRWHYGRYRGLVDAGRGDWWGAFQRDALVATAGVFHRDRWARYQEVTTALAHRGRGLATALCGAIAASVRAARPDATLVIVAEEGSTAERIYRRLGFVAIERQWRLAAARGSLRW